MGGGGRAGPDADDGRRAPQRPDARTPGKSDQIDALAVAWLAEQIKTIHVSNRRVYGSRAFTPSCNSLTASGSGANVWSG